MIDKPTGAVFIPIEAPEKPTGAIFVPIEPPEKPTGLVPVPIEPPKPPTGLIGIGIPDTVPPNPPNWWIMGQRGELPSQQYSQQARTLTYRSPEQLKNRMYDFGKKRSGIIGSRLSFGIGANRGRQFRRTYTQWFGSSGLY